MIAISPSPNLSLPRMGLVRNRFSVQNFFFYSRYMSWEGTLKEHSYTYESPGWRRVSSLIGCRRWEFSIPSVEIRSFEKFIISGERGQWRCFEVLVILQERVSSEFGVAFRSRSWRGSTMAILFLNLGFLETETSFILEKKEFSARGVWVTTGSISLF